MCVTALLGAGLSGVHREFGYRTLLGDDYPAIQRLEEFVQRYGGGFPVYIVWSCGEGKPCSSVFDKRSLGMARQVEDRMRLTDGVRDAYGPASASLLVAGPEGFAVRRFIEGDAVAADSEQLAARALADPLWVGNLISADGTVGAIIVLLVDTQSETMERVVDEVEAALEPFRAQGFEFHLAGHPVASVVAGRELAQSAGSVIPLTAVAIALTILALTRSFHAMVVTMLTMGIGLLWTFGLQGWLGWPQDSVHQVLAPLILIVGVCDSVHLFSCYVEEAAGRKGIAARREAMLAAARAVASPCVMTTLTTAAAFISFVTSDLDTFVRFGTLSAFGTMACLFLSFTLLPLLVIRLPAARVPVERGTKAWDTVARAVVHTSRTRRLPILLATGALCVVCAVGWARYLRVDTQPEEMFGEKSRVTRWDRFVNAHLRGSDSLEVEIVLPARSPLQSPETQAVLTRFSVFLRETEGLGRTTGVQDLIGRVNRVLHDDDPAFQRPGGSAETNAEILELLALDDQDTLERWVSLDGSRLRISVEGMADTSMTRGRVLSTVEEYVEREIPKDWSVSLTGPFALSYDWVNALQGTQVSSFVGAFLLVLALVTVYLRSPWLGLAAMVPSAVPVIVTLGLMGYAGMSLDVGRVMIAAIVIGIADFDAIHLLDRYRRARQAGEPVGSAAALSLRFVVRPVIVTSFALALGFLALTMSPWQTISSFGFLVTLSIFGALVATLFVLPAILFALERPENVRAGTTAESLGRRASVPSRKALLILSVVLLPALAIGGAALEISSGGVAKELACWILPNGRVARLGVDEGCPLRSNDQLRSVQVGGRLYAPVDDRESLVAALEHAGSTVRVGVVRSGQELWETVAVQQILPRARAARVASAFVIAAFLLSVPLLVLWRSSSAAAVPLAFVYSALAVVVVVVVCQPEASWLLLAGVCAAATAPALIVHLALAFPRERKVLREVPMVAVIPYIASVALISEGWVSLERDSAVWPTFLYILGAMTVGAWAFLAGSCAFALRESSVPLERARARVLLYGALLLPVIPAIARPGSGWNGVAVYVGAAAMLMPMPVALAISRYNLFDLGEDVRSAVSRLLYLALGALTLTATLIATGMGPRLSDAIPLFSLSLVCLVVMEGFRTRVLGALESLLSPRVSEVRDIADAYAQRIGELGDEEHVARLLADTLKSALHPRALAIFLREGDRWRRAHVLGREAVQPELAHDAEVLLGNRTSLHLVQEPGDPEPSARLREHGFELVVALKRGGNTVGLVMLTESSAGRPYGALERHYAVQAAQQAALALLNARLVMELVSKERQAATGRTALALLHELRKGLDWIRGLSKRVAGHLPEDGEARRDLRDLQELSVDLTESLEQFVREATREVPSHSAGLRLDHLLDRAIHVVARTHGNDRVVLAIDPQVRSLTVHESIAPVVVNVLDNALLASPEHAPVHLSATPEGGWIRVSVTDRGCGMDPETLERSFEAGFSTRLERGGAGVGLSISREMLEALGGKIELESTPGRGTRAILRIPSPDQPRAA